MLQKNQKILNRINMISDMIIIFTSYLLSIHIRFNVMNGKSKLNLFTEKNVLIVAFVLSVAVTISLYLIRFYRSFGYDRFWQELGRVVLVNTMAALLFIAILYAFKIQNFPRLIVFFNWGIANVLMIIKYIIMEAFLLYYRKRGYGQRHIIVVGNGGIAHQYMEDVQNNPRYGIRLEGYVGATEMSELGKYLGRYEELAKILEKNPIDEVVIALEPQESNYMKDVLKVVDKEGIRLSIIPFYCEYIPPYSTIEPIGHSKLIDMRATPLDNVAYAFLKRFVDVVGAVILIILTSPIMLITAIGVKFSSPGPILLRQERIGRYKKPFVMLKFRSMRVNEAENVGWSTNEDPRKTRFGSFIRKFSIDELPQLFNVLIGQMSLIGPRPEMTYHVGHFKEEVPLYLVRQQVRPGMTGWAQVNGLRGATSIEERVKYDIWYIENWSIGLEIKIFVKTIFGGMVNDEKIKK